MQILYPGRIGSWKCWFLWNEENRRTRRKTLRARREQTKNSMHIWHRTRIEIWPQLFRNWCEAIQTSNLGSQYHKHEDNSLPEHCSILDDALTLTRYYRQWNYLLHRWVFWRFFESCASNRPIKNHLRIYCTHAVNNTLKRDHFSCKCNETIFASVKNKTKDNSVKLKMSHVCFVQSFRTKTDLAILNNS